MCITDELAAKLRDRAAYLRDMKRVKSPHLMEQAASVIEALASRKVAVPDGYVLVPTSELDNLVKDWRTRQVSGNQALINVGAKKGMEWAADDLQEIVSNAKR